MIRRIAAVFLALVAVAHADSVVSYQNVNALYFPNYGSLTGVLPSDLLNVDTGTLVFSEIPMSPVEDVDAAHILANGDILFSSDTYITIPSPVGYSPGGRIISWNGSVYSTFWDSGLVNIDAFFVDESTGKYVLSTTSNQTLAGTPFTVGDLVLYDPVLMTASILFDDANISGTAAQKNIDAVHVLANGDILFSVLIDGGQIGGKTLKAANIYIYNPATGSVDLYLDGTDLYSIGTQGITRNLNAFTTTGSSTGGTGGQGVPEPGLLALVCFAAAAVLYRRRR